MNHHIALRAAHDIALAVWTGGALMGAVGLDGATTRAFDPDERLRLTAVGWERWTPLAAAAIATHCVLELTGATCSVAPAPGRGERVRQLVSVAVTVAAVATSAHSDLLVGAVQAEQFRATSPGADPHELTRAKQRLTAAHRATPLLTATLIALRSIKAQVGR